MPNEKSSYSETTIPLVEEVAKVDIHTRTTGRTRVKVRTEVVEDAVTKQLETRGVSVERVAIGRDLDFGEAVPEPRKEGNKTIIPVLEEVLIVEKRLRLVEEIHIHRTIETEDVSVPVKRRKQVADIEYEDTETYDPKPSN